MTNNHSYNTPEIGTTDWHLPLNENFDSLDRDVEIRDTGATRSEYTPKEGAKFLATDTGERFVGDGSQWNRLQYPGASADVDYDGSRPLVTTGSRSVTVNKNGSGDYRSLQAAVTNEIPWLVYHTVRISVADGSYDEHVVVPPYLANWVQQGWSSSGTAERVPIQINGNQGSPSNCQLSSFTVTGGTGTLQLRGFEFTSNTSAGDIDDENAHVANYHTDKLGLVNCRSGGNARRFIIAYNGRVSTRRNINAGDGDLVEYAKVKNMGNYQTGGRSKVTGRVTGNAYVVDNGTVHFNSHDASTLTGNNGLVRQFSGPKNDGGFAFDEGNGRMWLPGEARGIVVRDTTTGSEHEIVVNNGSVTANQL